MSKYFTEAETVAWLGQQPRKPLSSKVVVISDQGNVLLLKPTYKSTWQMPGGGVEAHEDPAVAAIRELAEETGIQAAAGDLRIVGTAFKAGYDALSLIYEYRVRVAEAIALALPSDEIEAAEFVHPSAVSSRLLDYYHPFWESYRIK